MSDTAYALQRIGFNKQELIISLENYAFKRSDANRFSKEVMSQNLKQLSHARDSLDSAYVIVKGRQLQDLLASGGLTTPSQLDSSQFKQYQAEFDIDSLGKFKTLYDEQLALEGALSATLEATSVLDNYQLDEYRYSYPLRKVRVERFRKFTLSFACFIFFFIGAPLGAIIRKGGLGTPVVVSMFFFVFYWVVDISGKNLRRTVLLLRQWERLSQPLSCFLWVYI